MRFQFGNDNKRESTCLFDGMESGEWEAGGDRDRRVHRSPPCQQWVVMDNTKAKWHHVWDGGVWRYLRKDIGVLEFPP